MRARVHTHTTQGNWNAHYEGLYRRQVSLAQLFLPPSHSLTLSFSPPLPRLFPHTHTPSPKTALKPCKTAAYSPHNRRTTVSATGAHPSHPPHGPLARACRGPACLRLRRLSPRLPLGASVPVPLSVHPCPSPPLRACLCPPGSPLPSARPFVRATDEPSGPGAGPRARILAPGPGPGVPVAARPLSPPTPHSHPTRNRPRISTSPPPQSPSPPPSLLPLSHPFPDDRHPPARAR